MQFKFKISYLQEVDYEVIGDGPVYIVTIKYGMTEYERTIFNGSSEDYDRVVKAKIGILHHHSTRERIRPEVVEAFNQWKADEHARAVKYFAEKYPDNPYTDPPDPPVVGGYYDLDAKPCVWVRYDQEQAA